MWFPLFFTYLEYAGSQVERQDLLATATKDFFWQIIQFY